MVKRQTKTSLAFCLFLLLLFMPGRTAAAPERVVDLADVFSDEQVSQLAGEADQLGQAYGMDIVIVTTADAQGKSARDFADDFFDEQGYGVGADYSGILFLIDYDNREAYISTSGEGIRYLTDQRIESVLDAAYSGLSADNPYDAARAFLATTSSYLADGIPSDQYTEDESGPNRVTWGEGILGALMSGASGLGFFARTKQKYKGKSQQPVFEFRRNSIANLGIVQDQMVKSFITTRIRPTQPVNRTGFGSGGRSTVHRSSSGRTHGGGGRKF
ncbi:MAG: hypothetical protein GX112_06650 [Clostridiaceae bacterium]|jgi:uncharacterized protein|nr:hypothetical protein [Clostridiaceae bacterium]